MCDQFIELHRFLHFVDNSELPLPETPAYKKFGKVQPIIDILLEGFAALVEPDKHISIDEAMIKFKGRSTLKQYLPKKPVKRGIKVWMRADATLGYVSAFKVYTSKKSGSVEKGLGANVVKCLTNSLNGSHRHVYFNNYFTGVDLLLDLYRSGLHGCGTLRSDRKGFPTELKPLLAKKGSQERGQSKVCQVGNLTLSIWQDNNPAVALATNADPTNDIAVNRKQKNDSSAIFSCPESVSLYNKYMGGVDHNDQHRQYYHVRLKCQKHYKYVFWFLFNVAITNAYILKKEAVKCRLPSQVGQGTSYSSRK